MAGEQKLCDHAIAKPRSYSPMVAINSLLLPGQMLFELGVKPLA